MLGVYSVQQHKVIATWNSDRDLWETSQTSLFEPLAVYSETWPTSRMTRNGTAYELPTSEHHTTGSGSSSLLPTPVADNYKESGNRSEERRVGKDCRTGLIPPGGRRTAQT